jgi:hypothetical protein
MLLTEPCHVEYVIFNPAQVLPMYGVTSLPLPLPPPLPPLPPPPVVWVDQSCSPGHPPIPDDQRTFVQLNSVRIWYRGYGVESR